MLGLYAFFHAALHFLLFFGFDRAANVADTVSEVLKRPYLKLSRTEQEIATMRTLKRALDPHGILNPGRIFTV